MLTSAPEHHAIEGACEVKPQPGVLAVTADLRLYAGVLNAASSAGWRTDWARTLTRAREICAMDSMPVILYDAAMPGIEWPEAIEELAKSQGCCRVLLAAPSVDEDLWCRVLQHGGYDVIPRSAGVGEFGRAFEFAWLSFLSRLERNELHNRKIPFSRYGVRERSALS
jgi:DNA-binding NtrC family response regulator